MKDYIKLKRIKLFSKCDQLHSAVLFQKKNKKNNKTISMCKTKDVFSSQCEVGGKKETTVF